MALPSLRKPDLLTFIVVGILGLAIFPSNVMCQCNCAAGLCCSQYGYCDTGEAFCGEGCQAGPCTIPANDFVVGDYVTAEFFDGIKNQRQGGDCPGKSFYTRDAFLTALNSYPRFCRIGSIDDSKREIAAFFAHVTHETGFMCSIEEDNRQNNYCEDDQTYPCVAGKFYYGRGPLQLTGNKNYGEAGRVLQFDGLNAPEQVATDPVLSFRTALWFWQANVHTVMKNGFGETIRKINGPKECNNADPGKVQNRIKYYTDYCNRFGVDPGQNLSC